MTLRLLLTALFCEKGDIEGNLARHLDALSQAGAEGCAAAVFPEFSLTGYVEPLTAPHRAISADEPAVSRLVAATRDLGVAAVFGYGERAGDTFWITQAVAVDGEIVAVQRKRHLGEGEEGHGIGEHSAVFDLGGVPTGIVICAESTVDWTWDATAAAGARLVLFSSAPGLYGQRDTPDDWREGFAWWESDGLGDARRHASRLGRWVAMSTQAGRTVDEDFPGLAALVGPDGDVVARLPDWHPGTLVVEVPLG